MLKQYALFPFLFILYVIFNPLITNLDQVNPAQAWRPLFVLTIVAAILLSLLRAIVKSWHYASYILLLILFWFFTYGHLNNLISDKVPEAYAEASPLVVLAILLILLVVLGLRKTWNRLGGVQRVTPFLNLVLVFAVISQGVFGLRELVQRSTNPGSPPDGENPLIETNSEVTLDCSISPDIYWIVLDGYGRADVLQGIYGVDNSEFLASLERKGFYIADQSHSNYMQTVYSIPSTLNMSYLHPMPADVSGYDYFPELIANNQFIALLRQCGYQVVSFESGFFFTNYPSADVHFSFSTILNEFEGLLLTGTPLDLAIDKLNLQPPKSSYDAHRGRVSFEFDKLAKLPEMTGPKFVYAHIISPHPPFVFDAKGNPIRPRRGYSIGDGDDYRGSLEEYHKGYAAQIQYVNQLIEQTVSAIIRDSASPPVIILQSDHGPGSYLNWKSPAGSCLWERTSILNAYYLPNGGSQLLDPAITPVNSFRVVLNAYFGANLELLPSEAYFTSHRLGGDFINITDRRESKANCN